MLGGWEWVEPVVFISGPSVPSVGNIKTHITAQVKGLTNSDTGFRVTQDLYLSLVSQERKLIHQERKFYAKITYSSHIGWAGTMCQGWFLCRGGWKGDRHMIPETQEHPIKGRGYSRSSFKSQPISPSPTPPCTQSPTSIHTHPCQHTSYSITPIFLLCPSHNVNFSKT